jgi:cell volume regulation protein A
VAIAAAPLPADTLEVSDADVLTAEPFATGLIFAGVGALLTISVMSSRASARLGVPLALLFLVVGMLAGSEGIGGIPFEDYSRTYRLGTGALCLILFDGGLHTSPRAMREVAAPAIVLATLGVILTAMIVAVAAHLAGYSWSDAFLVGAIVSPTDAAAVFSVITSSGVRLRRRIELLLEVESGLNDPMAVILATALTIQAAGGGSLSIGGLALDVVEELAIGLVLGFAIGWTARWSVRRLNLPATGLYPVFTVGIAALAFSLPTLAHGSGFLGVYIAGSTLGAGELPEEEGIRRVHNALGWLSQITMFLVLGLLVFPTRLAAAAGPGIAIALVLAVAARPVSAFVCLAPFRLSIPEMGFVGWTGLRGAVPIILATIPVLGGAPGARELFDLVFFVVVAGALVPGATIGLAARRLSVNAP